MVLKAVGINIFGGGFTLGVRAAGFDVLTQLEECDAGRKTFDLNFRGIPRPLTYADWPLADLPRPNLVYANPPCAPWSSANVRKNEDIGARLADPRLAMTARTMETAMALKPDVFVCESVSEAYTRGRAYYDTWTQRWLAQGYGVTYFLTDAILHGVPSERRRFHFIAHRRRLPLVEPDMGAFVPRTVRQAIGDIHDRFGHVTHHMPRRFDPQTHADIGQCEPGGKLRAVSRKYSFMARRLYWDSPALTVAGMHLIAHPSRSRYITIREGLRLCGYPDTFVVAERTGHASSATQAVMPRVGEWLARLASASLKEPPARRELEIVDWRELAKPYRQQSVLAAARESGESCADEYDPLPAHLELQEDMAGDWLMAHARCANMTRDEALETFGANWPERARELDALRDDVDWLCGAVLTRQDSPRRVSGGPRPVSKGGSGQRFRELILQGKSNQEALDVVKGEFPDGKSTLSDAAWNRYELKRHPEKYDERGARSSRGR